MSAGTEETRALPVNEEEIQDGSQASDSSKLKTLLTILKRTVGVKDLASLYVARLTQPNLEYWNYQGTIGDYEDPLDRMLATVRYSVTKELKFVYGRVCKPYNSILGEHFRCHWDVAPLTVNAQGEHRPSEALNTQQPLALKLPGQGAAPSSGRRRVIYLTEQVSHHPPISSYYYDCPEAGLSMVGVDQVSAKFTGTAVRIYPGEFNQGMFITLGPNVRAQNAVGEEYRITHPAGAIFGLFRGSFWPAVTDTATITCTPPRGSQTYLRAIIEYKEESWLSKPKYAVEGCIYTYEPGQPSASYSALKEVPSKNVVVQLQGTWRGVITWKRKGEKTAHPLVNLADLQPCPRDVRPIDAQDAWESRRIWKDVTDAIVGQQYSRATQLKQQVEQRQRELAAERKKTGAEFVPQFFERDVASGRPRLTNAGRAAVEEERRRPAGAAGAALPAPARDEDNFEDAPSF